MSEKFTASNGQTVAIVDGDLMVGNPPLALSPVGVAAMREFFLHERDQELGRWRWPENPEYVAYDLGVRVVRIAHEPTGNSWDLDEFSLPNHIVGGRQSWHRTAQAYFAAHPLPKPWHDAKPGEVWALTVDGKEDAFKLHGDLFRTGNLHDIEQTDRHISAGRRIWPEVVEP